MCVARTGATLPRSASARASGSRASGYGYRMTFSVRVLWSPDLLGYDFGPGHPMAPARLDLTIDLATALGLFDAPGVVVQDVAPAPDELLQRVHDGDYVAAVRAASTDGTVDLHRGLGTEDDPIFPGMHDAAARIVAGTCSAADAVWSGETTHAVNLAGGMHHAMPDAAAGFCIYNDAAVAISRLLDSGAERVAYVDLDAHHGDGVERVFWDDPRVLTVSVHQTGANLFPGTGFPTDTGGPNANGTTVNLALPARTDSEGWLRAVDAILPEVLREFEPQIIVSQHGCDAHGDDPLSDLRVDVCAQRQAAEWVHELSHELCDGKWVALGGGGYAVTNVVPFAWTHLLAIAAHAPLADATPVPDAWRERLSRDLGCEAAHTMSGADEELDCKELRSWRAGFNPADEVDRAIQATRSASFPLLGIINDAY